MARAYFKNLKFSQDICRPLWNQNFNSLPANVENVVLGYYM